MKTIYHSLFESHMTYCISVWGNIAQTHIEKLFRLQKRCIRILFGDQEQYKSKFETAARCRPFHHQNLNQNFYCKEHTKPLFSKYEILTVQNLYTYQTGLEITKLLKYRTPTPIHSLFSTSTRVNSNILILPKHSKCFTYQAAKIWNVITKTITKSLCPISIKLSVFKNN